MRDSPKFVPDFLARGSYAAVLACVMVIAGCGQKKEETTAAPPAGAPPAATDPAAAPPPFPRRQ